MGFYTKATQPDKAGGKIMSVEESLQRKMDLLTQDK